MAADPYLIAGARAVARAQAADELAQSKGTQEVVIKHSSGYDMVDYYKIDVEFKNII